MPHHIPWEVKVKPHPGSSKSEIHNEPDWTKRRSHSIGFKNRDGGRTGITHPDHDQEQDYSNVNREAEEREHAEEVAEACRKRAELKHKIDSGELVNFRDVIEHQYSFHIRHPENRSLGWRYVLETTEDWVKEQQPWPANLERRKKQQDVEGGEEPVKTVSDGKEPDEEAWRRKTDGSSPQLTAQERTLLESIANEGTYMSHLQQNNGKQPCPQKNNRSSISIDEQDQFTPDNWLPRCPDLIRLTGKHPMNAEPPLTRLLDGGLITPNELHYIRNHGPVPRLLWELHRLDISDLKGRTTTLSMDQLKDSFRDSVINIPVAMACTGNRRRELNLQRKTKGANNGAASVGCAYWKGPLLRDVLVQCGIPPPTPTSERLYVNFAGADSPSEGPYETSIPLEYAMDSANDVILAMYMNDLPLPPDHGYPVRLIIPGYIGGRCVKWLRRIWITGHENTSYYHVWDNRVMPSWVLAKDSEAAKVLFHHPSTACYEQNMNSVILKPAPGEERSLQDVKAGEMYTVQGYAYNGGGHEVQQVEVSVDGGKTWLFASRKFPEYPIRHGSKFWTWLFWHVDVELSELVRSPGITVRCSDVAKNVQPEGAKWNLMGMMNNSWYTVKSEIITDTQGKTPATVRFRHPTEAGTLTGGWIQPSEEVKLAEAKQEAGTPEKKFTREEIEKHDKEGDCWIVVDNKVYDATSVLKWHPGGKAAILAHAAKCHQETTEQFASIHDDFAYKKLHECILGAVTEKTADFIKQTANPQPSTPEPPPDSPIALQQHRWIPVKLIARHQLSPDTTTYTFALPQGKTELGLGTCQHLQLGFHLQDKMLIRPYTPTRPIPPIPPNTTTPPTSPITTPIVSSKKKKSRRRKKPPSPLKNLNHHPPPTFDLTIKTYPPTPSQPGGALTSILSSLPLNETVDIRGPTGDIIYTGSGNFSISSSLYSSTTTTATTITPHNLHFTHISLLLAGSGITPGYALLSHIFHSLPHDRTKARVIDANRTERDILLKDELDKFQAESKHQIEIMHVLSHPSKDWTGKMGYVTPEIIREGLFPPDDNSVVFLCGPPGLVQGVALPALRGEFDLSTYFTWVGSQQESC
ncbi:nitrate reductase [NADH] [Cercophora samala]|uniref:Nitrate reductase [NADPH] n=1 Tax=Cercophora samala TaxID=330535 RepID=A0AA40D6F8_9PEZI|nr:nitrate reductase [NADH] [Cercophora samala]